MFILKFKNFNQKTIRYLFYKYFNIGVVVGVGVAVW